MNKDQPKTAPSPPPSPASESSADRHTNSGDVTSGIFTSRRERRLWMRTLLVVVAIYSTLGLASVLARWAYHQQLVTAAFVACLLLVGLTILTQGLRYRPRGVEVGVALGLAAVYLLVFLRLAIPERSHLIEYGVVGSFVYEALRERGRHGRLRRPALAAVTVTLLIGTVDEVLQLFLPGRVFDTTDIAFNGLAALFAVGSASILHRLRPESGDGPVQHLG